HPRGRTPKAGGGIRACSRVLITNTVRGAAGGRAVLSSRRALLGRGVALGAGAVGAGLVAEGLPAVAEASALPPGDPASLRFLAALAILETDVWQQYNELGGVQDGEVPGGSGSKPYTKAIQVLDADMPQYVHDNTEDEFTHFTFLNAYLASRGATPINLD